MTTTADDLKRALLTEYGGFADKRTKNLDKASVFIVDDRQPRDVGSDKQLYGYFCTIFAEVADGEHVAISFGNLPQGAPVTAWLSHYGMQVRDGRLRVVVTLGTLELLTSLAEALRSIVAPGAPRYNAPSYKYVCPRTAESLDRLVRLLAKAWSLSN